MASKRKSASFEIPDAVRQAGQSGWVYRTSTTTMKAKTTRPAAALPRPPQAERVTAIAMPEAVAARTPEETRQTPVGQVVEQAAARPVAAVQAVTAAGLHASSLAGRLIQLGLRVAIVLFVVPQYLLTGNCLARPSSPRH